MSDISITFEWWEWILAVFYVGWPGALAGAALGAASAPRRRIAAAIVCACLGAAAVFAFRLMLK